MNASGAIVNNFGVREFIVGTGGAGLETPGTEVPTSQVPNATTHGIMTMTLHNGSYSWQLINNGESSFIGSGSATCHAKP
jgi:acid phosphatase type 7